MRNGLGRKFRSWIRRVLGSVRRRQRDCELIIPEDKSSRSCCDHVGETPPVSYGNRFEFLFYFILLFIFLGGVGTAHVLHAFMR